MLSDWWLSNWWVVIFCTACAMYVTILSLSSPSRAECSTYNITDVDLTNTTVSELCRLTTNQRIAIYTAATVITVLLGFARCILIYFLFLNASRVVHNRMFGAVLRAPVHFFDTNPSGDNVNTFVYSLCMRAFMSFAVNMPLDLQVVINTLSMSTYFIVF